MEKKYSFLKDEIAIIEIRKHKWLESERVGQEIGFATAAVDWIKQYGEAFKQFRLANETETDPLKEKRQYRRFPSELPLQLSINNRTLRCRAKDINLVGLSCTVPAFIPNDTIAQVSLQFNQKRHPEAGPSFTFQSRIARVADEAGHRLKRSYRVFLPFSEEVRDYLRVQTNLTT
jgi:hypothetical protein